MSGWLRSNVGGKIDGVKRYAIDLESGTRTPDKIFRSEVMKLIGTGAIDEHDLTATRDGPSGNGRSCNAHGS